MEDFNFRGKTFKFWKISGEVISTNKRGESHLSAGGNNQSISISTTIVTKHEFWLKTSNGDEKSITLWNIDIPLREGQNITMIAAGDPVKKNDKYTILINHTAKTYNILLEVSYLMKMLNYGYNPMTYLTIMFIAITFLISSFISTTLLLLLNESGLFLILGDIVSIYCIYAITASIRKRMILNKKLTAHLNDIANKELAGI